MIKRKKSIYDFIINQKITLSILKPNFISVDYHIVGSKLIQAFKKHHPVLVWTIRNKDIKHYQAVIFDNTIGLLFILNYKLPES